MTEELKEPGGRVRLFVEGGLSAGATLSLDEGQAHYLVHVMRAKADDNAWDPENLLLPSSYRSGAGFGMKNSNPLFPPQD